MHCNHGKHAACAICFCIFALILFHSSKLWNLSCHSHKHFENKISLSKSCTSRSNAEFAPFLDLRGWEIWFVLWPSWRDTSENVWESLFFHRLGHISVLFAFEWRFFRRWPACHREQQVRIVQSNVLHWSCIVSNAALKLITTNACDPHSKRREQLHGNLALVRQFWRFVGKWFLGPSYWTRRKP